MPEQHHRASTERAIRYGLLAQGLALAAMPVSLLLIARCLSPQLQGYYYTMASLLALQVFFELGLSTVLTQFFSHEFVGLRWYARGRIGGDLQARRRTLATLAWSTRWFTAAGLVMTLVLAPMGLTFFPAGQADRGDWLAPWLLAVAASAACLPALPLVALESGSGHIVQMSRREVRASLVALPVSWGLLWAGHGLYAVAAVPLVRLGLFMAYFMAARPALVRALLRPAARGPVHAPWRSEIWPLQWRVSVSCVAGYLVSQLFTPVVFYFRGADDAGRMGMSVAAAAALATIASTLVNVRAAHLGHLVARRQWQALDALFLRTLGQGMALGLAGALAGAAAVALLQRHDGLGHRFLPAWQLATLLLAACVQVAIHHLGVYLRAYKREPLMGLTVTHGALQASVAVAMGSALGSGGVVLGVLAVNTLVLPLALRAWRQCRRQWQRAELSASSPGALPDTGPRPAPR